MKRFAAVAGVVALAGLPVVWLAVRTLAWRDPVPPDVERAVVFFAAPALYPFAIAGFLLAIPFGSFPAMMLSGHAVAALQYPVYGLLLRRPETRRARFRVILTVHLTILAVYTLFAALVWLLNRRGPP